MKTLVKTCLSIMVAGSSISTLYSCTTHETAVDTRQGYVIPDSLFKSLVIDTVKTSPISDATKFSGVVDFDADKVVNVFPLITGNVQDIKVILGDYVHKGQVLGVIKSAEIANYNSALITAKATVKLTERQLSQQKSLYGSGLASQVDVASAEVAYDQALAARTAASRILNINGNSSNGQYLIKAPIDGFIVQKNVTNGMSIRSDNGTGLFTISNLKDIWVQTNVYETNIGKVHQGDLVDVTTITYPDKVFKGRVSNLMSVLDPTTKVMKMRVVLDNHDYLLKPQMFTTVTVHNTENTEATAVSSKDLVFDHSQYYVVVVNGKKDVQIRPVEIISINDKTAYIKNGVKPGERLVGSNALLIYGSLNS